jgi:hypothetical protein
VFFDLIQNVSTLPLLPAAITGNPGGITATISEGAVNNIGGGVNMNGSGQSLFDVGVRIGISGGIGGGDDFQMGMFTVAGVSITDFTSIGVRVKSVDVGGGFRTGSSKLSGPVPNGNGEPIPEPTTIVLLSIGLVGLAGAAARRKFKKEKKQ